jgi:hypothetical protein
MERDRGPSGRRTGPHQNESGGDSAAECAFEALRETDGDSVDDDHARYDSCGRYDSSSEHDACGCDSFTNSGCLEPDPGSPSHSNAGRCGVGNCQSEPCGQSQRDPDG